MNTTTETVQHTPTPWRRHDTEHDAIVGPDRKAIALVMGRSRTTEEDDANLAFIVRACNNHEALVAALKPFADLINWADISESDADEDAFLAGTRNDVQRICGAKTAVLTVGDLRRAKAALATATQ